jgi:hypothetical protein
VERWIELLREELRDRPVGELLTEERQIALTGAAERWLAEAVEGDAFAGAIQDYVDRGAVRLLKPDRTFEQLLPVQASSPRSSAPLPAICRSRSSGSAACWTTRARARRSSRCCTSCSTAS